jgi:Mg-chelatase subunit ChlD
MSSTTSDTLVLTTAAETKGCAFNKEVTVTFNANIKAPEMKSDDHEQRKSVDIVCVIDKSGSMSGNPMELVKETLGFMVSQLKEGDRLSLVTFGDDASLVFSLTNMNEEGKNKALTDIKALRADGWTHLSGGIFLGLEQLAARPESEANAVSSILVFTDGEANRGISKTEELVKATVAKLDGIRGAISLHTFGFSQNHNPELLTKLAEAANGVFYYLASADRISEVFADCLGGLLSVVAMNVNLEVISEYSGARIVNIHTPFTVREISLGTHSNVSLGQMYSEQSRDVLVDVKLPAIDASDLDAKVLKFRLTSTNRLEQPVETTAFATIDRTTEDAEAVKQVNEEVVKQKARVVTATAMKEALAHKASGRTAQAAQVLSSARTNMASAGFGTYAAQLDTAEQEISSGRSGYLWTNMRSHYAQSSSAQPVALEQVQAYGAAPSPSLNDQDFHGYSNSIQRKMKAAAPRQPQQQQPQQPLQQQSILPPPPQAYAYQPQQAPQYTPYGAPQQDLA